MSWGIEISFARKTAVMIAWDESNLENLQEFCHCILASKTCKISDIKKKIYWNMVKFKPWGLIVCEISIRITLVNSFFFFSLSLQMKEKYLTWFNVFFFFKHHEQASVPCDWDGCLYYTGGKRQNLTTLPLFPTWQTRIWKAFFFFFQSCLILPVWKIGTTQSSSSFSLVNVTKLRQPPPFLISFFFIKSWTIDSFLNRKQWEK